MTVSPTLFGTLWTASFLGWGTLTFEYLRRLRNQRDSIADEIRSLNARNGFGQSVDKEDLALDLMVPRRSESLEEFATNIGKPPRDYISQLEMEVGVPRSVWGLGFHLLGVFYTISGISYLIPGGIFSSTGYLLSIYLWFLISLVLFLYFFYSTTF